MVDYSVLERLIEQRQARIEKFDANNVLINELQAQIELLKKENDSVDIEILKKDIIDAKALIKHFTEPTENVVEQNNNLGGVI